MPNASKLLLYGFLYAVTIGMVASVFLLHPYPGDDFPFLRDIIIVFASVLLAKYFTYMIVSPWHEVLMRRRELAHAKGMKDPLVSVIIPAWNEEVGLVRTVASVLRNLYRPFEVIVVNDGSTDASDALMRAFAAEYDAKTSGIKDAPRLRYFYKENGGKGRALNYGIERAEGQIIVTVDADCALLPGTLAAFARCFRDPKIDAAVGNVKIGNTSTVLGTVQYLEFLFSFYFKKAESIANTIYIIGGAAGAFRRSVFDRVGWFDHRNITEDIDFSMRIQKAGMRIAYASDAVVYTEGATSFEGLMSQRLRWKRGRFQTFRAHRDLFFSTKPEHNKLLTWLMLPLALFGDLQLFFELYFLAFLYIYSLLTHDFSSFMAGIVVVCAMFFVQIFFEEADDKPISFYLLAPICWLLFYLSTFVEYTALVQSLWGSFTKQRFSWQRWKREGCFDENAPVAPLTP